MGVMLPTGRLAATDSFLGQNAGLTRITARLGDPLPERGGKARRLARVEPAGRTAVRESRQAFQRMWGGLGARLEEE
jgi:hypothetical protein